ncbi:MAG: DnaA regulatory inactivator Hda [Burkholderiales bacterium]
MQQLLLELAPPPAPTLANFIPGRNGAALQALRSALAGGEPFVYLWGAGGSGRTHLLRGFIEAAQATRAAGFFSAAAADWSRAATLQAVAVDDVLRLDASGQIALFDLCNRLRGSGGVLAASGTAPPAQLALRPDLRSRLAAGIVLQIHPLSDAEKAAALRGHAASRGIALGEDLIRYLLTQFERDMGTQIALLDALDRYSLEHKRPITLPLLKEALRSLGQRQAGS